MALMEIDFELIFQSKILFAFNKDTHLLQNEWTLIDFVSGSLELGNKIICH